LAAKRCGSCSTPRRNTVMNPVLVRKLVLSLIEAALGRDTFPIWRELILDVAALID